MFILSLRLTLHGQQPHQLCKKKHGFSIKEIHVLKTANWTGSTSPFRDSTLNFQRRLYSLQLLFKSFSYFEHTLSCTQSYHDIELSVSQGSKDLK